MHLRRSRNPKADPPKRIKGVEEAIAALGDPKRAQVAVRYFKAGPGEYAAGDVFLGVRVPNLRTLMREYANLSLQEIDVLLKSKIHEFRLAALLVLVRQFEKGTQAEQRRLYRFYVQRLRWVNHWDLVDTSAPTLMAGALSDRPERWKVLSTLARSPNVWRRRVAMVGTLGWIRRGQSAEAFQMAELLLDDSHDLMHKAMGWMLREVGKKCGKAPLQSFLTRHGSRMPRTALRYAIERWPSAERKAILTQFPPGQASSFPRCPRGLKPLRNGNEAMAAGKPKGT